MANPLSTLLSFSSPTSTRLPLQFRTSKIPNNSLPKPFQKTFHFPSKLTHDLPKKMTSTSVGAGTDLALVDKAIQLVNLSPPTWQSALLSNLIIFVLGSPLLVAGLSFSGIVAAFVLGSLTWRAFDRSGFLLVAAYFVIGTAATKVKIAQKEAQGVAEKRKGRRGPGSVIGSSAAGCVCALLSIYGIGGQAYARLWELGFVASFCTKLSDTVSSEIGKAYGRTTYLVTTFKVVPRGTEGAVSVEGTVAGLLASILLASVSCIMGVVWDFILLPSMSLLPFMHIIPSEINVNETIVCIAASQIANLGESVIGASLQEKEGFKWLNNDLVNIINVSIGSTMAIIMQQILVRH